MSNRAVFYIIPVACLVASMLWSASNSEAQQTRNTPRSPYHARQVRKAAPAHPKYTRQTTTSARQVSRGVSAEPARPSTVVPGLPGGTTASGTVRIGYPDPKSIRVPAPIIGGTPPGPIDRDRYAKISELERLLRIYGDEYRRLCEGVEPAAPEPCPLCVEDPKTPCGTCKMCKAGFPCEKTLCRHCVQQRSQNMCNSCDLSAGDEPCGTCDACREHRSDPCEHADDGHGPRGEFNPYKEHRVFSTLPRPMVDVWNNGARKFPVYYNPAPYYRPHWNPSLFTGYARPYSFRWSCPLCYKDPCECDKPGFAGQVPYAYSCKFCNRNPCACAAEICNVTKELNPKGVSRSLEDEKKTSTRIQDTHAKPTPGTTPLQDAPENRSDILSDEKPSVLKDEETAPTTEPVEELRRRPPLLDSPESNEPPLPRRNRESIN